MRKLLLAAALTTAVVLVGGAVASRADDGTGTTLDLPRPAWLTDDLEARIIDAGPQGVEVALGSSKDATVNANCLGTAPPYVGTDGVSVSAVAAGTCMVSPAGCTMNFIFTDGNSYYIGTAGHCVSGGRTVIAQIARRVDPTDTVIATLAAIGTVSKSWNQGIGKDFALVKINSGSRSFQA